MREFTPEYSDDPSYMQSVFQNLMENFPLGASIAGGYGSFSLTSRKVGDDSFELTYIFSSGAVTECKLGTKDVAKLYATYQNTHENKKTEFNIEL